MSHTNTKNVNFPVFSINGLVCINEKLQESLITRFEGIPVQVDETLSDNDYYIALSPALYAEVIKRYPYKKV